ncbi:3'-5' exonuclease [Bacillus sp. JCM 19034]|uniref:UvrD-helicase domain-containing protein n=1 Tax=Bacillus sp. JCM 19034 TaxID=1481928 RepID=UPI0007810F95
MDAAMKAMPKRTNKSWEEQAPSLYELYEKHWKPLKEDWKKIGGPTRVNTEATVLLEAIVSLIKEFNHRYQLEKQRATLLDFNDLQQKAVSLLNKPSIQRYCKEQFRHMMVDEFQDTNRLQLEVLEKIDPYYQFIVGDQKQSIYRFRGANVRLMNEMEEKAKNEEDAEALLMNENYRTLSPVIDAINELFATVMVKERTEDFQTVYTPLIGHRHLDQDIEQKRVELMIMSEEDLEKESQFDQLANRMVAMVEDKQILVEDKSWRAPTWGDMAILIPSRTNLLSLEQSLTKKNIPYVINGGVGFFERQEVIDFVTMIRWLTRPFEEIHLLAVLRSPLNGLSVEDFFQIEETLDDGQALFEIVYEYSDKWMFLSNEVQKVFERIQSWLNRWVPLTEVNGLEDSLMEVFVDTGLRASLLLQEHGLQKVKNVEKVIRWMVERQEGNLEVILAELDVRIELSEKEGDSEIERVQGDVVQIMTVHASKGLEFPIVFLPQLERALRKDSGRVRFHPQFGFVLNVKKEHDNLDEKSEIIDTPGYELVKSIADAEALEESKRLLYVAMTRARDYLYLIGNESTGNRTWLSFLKSALEKHQLQRYIIESQKYDERNWQRENTRSYSLPRIEKRNTQNFSLTVSEIMMFMHDPDMYYQRFVLGIPIESEHDHGSQSQNIRGITLLYLVL